MAQKEMTEDLMKTMDNTIEELNSSFENLRKKARKALTPPGQMHPVLGEKIKAIPGYRNFKSCLNSSRSLQDLSLQDMYWGEKPRNHAEEPNNKGYQNLPKPASTRPTLGSTSGHDKRTKTEKRSLILARLNTPKESTAPATISVMPSNEDRNEQNAVNVKVTKTVLTNNNIYTSSPSGSTKMGVDAVPSNRLSGKRKALNEPCIPKKFKHIHQERQAEKDLTRPTPPKQLRSVLTANSIKLVTSPTADAIRKEGGIGSNPTVLRAAHKNGQFKCISQSDTLASKAKTTASVTVIVSPRLHTGFESSSPSQSDSQSNSGLTTPSKRWTFKTKTSQNQSGTPTSKVFSFASATVSPSQKQYLGSHARQNQLQIHSSNSPGATISPKQGIGIVVRLPSPIVKNQTTPGTRNKWLPASPVATSSNQSIRKVQLGSVRSSPCLDTSSSIASNDNKTSALSIIESMREELMCAICTEELVEPKDLGCSHYFCKGCLQEWADSQGKKTTVTCPVCSQTTQLPDGKVDGLKTNIIIRNLAQQVKQARQAEQQGNLGSQGRQSQLGSFHLHTTGPTEEQKEVLRQRMKKVQEMKLKCDSNLAKIKKQYRSIDQSVEEIAQEVKQYKNDLIKLIKGDAKYIIDQIHCGLKAEKRKLLWFEGDYKQMKDRLSKLRKDNISSVPTGTPEQNESSEEGRPVWEWEVKCLPETKQPRFEKSNLNSYKSPVGKVLWLNG